MKNQGIDLAKKALVPSVDAFGRAFFAGEDTLRLEMA
jgi:hypothetical protein